MVIPNNTMANNTQPNNTMPNNTQPNNTQPNNTQPNNTMANNTMPNNTMANNTMANNNTSIKKSNEDDINVSGDTNILISCNNDTGKAIYVVFHITMSFIAIYLSWRCNGKFDLLSFLIALLFPYVYIIYILATRGTCSV